MLSAIRLFIGIIAFVAPTLSSLKYQLVIKIQNFPLLTTTQIYFLFLHHQVAQETRLFRRFSQFNDLQNVEPVFPKIELEKQFEKLRRILPIASFAGIIAACTKITFLFAPYLIFLFSYFLSLASLILQSFHLHFCEK